MRAKGGYVSCERCRFLAHTEISLPAAGWSNVGCWEQGFLCAVGSRHHRLGGLARSVLLCQCCQLCLKEMGGRKVQEEVVLPTECTATAGMVWWRGSLPGTHLDRSNARVGALRRLSNRTPWEPSALSPEAARPDSLQLRAEGGAV